MRQRLLDRPSPTFIAWTVFFALLLSVGATGCGKGAEATKAPLPKTSLDRTAADPLGSLATDKDKVVVADFGRNTCPSCVEMGRILDRVGPGVADTAIIMKINVDREPALIRKYGIRLIPTVLIFDPAGRLVLRHEGVLKERDLLRVIDKARLGVG